MCRAIYIAKEFDDWLSAFLRDKGPETAFSEPGTERVLSELMLAWIEDGGAYDVCESYTQFLKFAFTVAALNAEPTSDLAAIPRLRLVRDDEDWHVILQEDYFFASVQAFRRRDAERRAST